MSTESATKSFSHPEFQGLVGLARSNITPPEGIYARLWGSATHDVAEGVHQPMLATCVILKSESTSREVALITLDAIALWQEEADRIRDALRERFGLQPQQLMLHPSHTHSSPALARRHADRSGGHLIAPYLDSLPQTCCELVAAARASAFPGSVGWAYGKCGLAFNRDSLDELTGRGICGINRDRAADDTVLVGRISDAKGQVRGVLVNYACHPVSMGGGNKLLSPDYVGPMRDVVERETGAVCVFLHGASGDLTPRRSYESSPDAAEQNGRELGFAALSILSGMLPPSRRLEYQRIEESGTPLGIWGSTAKPEMSSVLEAQCVQIKLPLKDYPPRDAILARIRASTERYEVERLERMLAIRERLGEQTIGTFPVTVWRVGDAYLVSTTGEPYSRYQMALREQFAGSTVAVLNLTNGATNYLPEQTAYEQDNYPARVTEYAPGCLERVIKETSAVMHRL
ncbi:MAG TPA: neutral/alkaline non-lysosomal ceramidase N-terminal domain-containing protein [Steroidobacteraceae bacterium]|jgi:hypothetical protein|nr:neutral/alkaline non-lysosomal ceramidase N-terminal domain-containing protein [Steroidobacteraceae bacterium]